MKKDVVVSVRNLEINIYTENRCNVVVDDISFDAKKGKTLCIVGESGCGKTITASAIIDLLPKVARVESGEIMFYDGEQSYNICNLTEKQICNIRGSKIAMIYQDPMMALNPVYTIGYQLNEVLKTHTNLNKTQRSEKIISILKDVNIPDPERRMTEYPHQFSGGMRQRVMIAMGMLCNPQLLIADEPTTALDVTIQAQIFELMNKLKYDYNTGIILITHNMAVVAEMADEVVVMYMGHIVEQGDMQEILKNPKHPYTKALFKSVLTLNTNKEEKLESIKGQIPNAHNRPKGCQFGPRCDHYTKLCEEIPPEFTLNDTHSVKCWLYKGES